MTHIKAIKERIKAGEEMTAGTTAEEIEKKERDRENKFIWDFTKYMTKKHGTFHMFGAETCEIIAEVMHFTEKQLFADSEAKDREFEKAKEVLAVQAFEEGVSMGKDKLNRKDKQIAELKDKFNHWTLESSEIQKGQKLYNPASLDEKEKFEKRIKELEATITALADVFDQWHSSEITDMQYFDKCGWILKHKQIVAVLTPVDKEGIIGEYAKPFLHDMILAGLLKATYEMERRNYEMERRKVITKFLIDFFAGTGVDVKQKGDVKP